MPKLTDSSIKAAACPADKHRMELSDTACPALEIRVAHVGVLSGSRLGRRARQDRRPSEADRERQGPTGRAAPRTPALRPFRGTHVQPALRQIHLRVRKGPRRGGKPEQELLEKRCGLPEEAPPALGASACQLDHT